MDASAINDALVKMCCITTTIILGCPEDLLDLDMSFFPPFAWFISFPEIEKGTFRIIDGGELKKIFVEFAIQHPERVFKGTKKMEETDE